MLLHTPFTASGVITALSVDANGTTHVSLHEEPGGTSLWRYLATSLFFVALLICLVVNVLLTLRGIRKDHLRQVAILHYYDTCFNPSLNAHQDPRSLF